MNHLPIDNTYQWNPYEPVTGAFGQDFAATEEEAALANLNRGDNHLMALKNQKIQIALSVALIILLVYVNFFKEKKG